MKTHLFRTLSRNSLRAVNGGRTQLSASCGDFRCIADIDFVECALSGPVCSCMMDTWCNFE
ncbi:hypothetical protein [Chitinophaga niabensis]|uniref:hypothetical protein n=1 Tax=Chitinophaga niabensis TaxID=536979 RepID=UPI001160F6BE|nr:hypothetical protein [Chitinophaga niabensis]